MTTTERDLTKLPKWAQEYIENLQNALSQKTDEIKVLNSGHPGTNVATRRGLDYFELPKDSHITFWMQDEEPAIGLREGIEVYHSGSAYGAELYVVARNGRLVVLPSASNSARLTVR